MKMLFNNPVDTKAVTAIKLLPENRLTTGAASATASVSVGRNSRKRKAPRGTRPPGQNAATRRWSASPKRWMAPKAPRVAAAWLTHARETNCMMESAARIACNKLRCPGVRATIQRMPAATRPTITRKTRYDQIASQSASTTSHRFVNFQLSCLRSSLRRAANSRRTTR